MPAPNTEVMAMPASTTVSREVFAPSEMPKTMSAVASAPTNAASGGSHTSPGNTEAASRTNRPAPELMPMMLGLASGLSSTAWMIAPAAESAAPESSAASTRGSRTFTRMLFAASLTSPPDAQATRSPRLTDDDPTRNAATVTTARAAATATDTNAPVCLQETVFIARGYLYRWSKSV